MSVSNFVKPVIGERDEQRSCESKRMYSEREPEVGDLVRHRIFGVGGVVLASYYRGSETPLLAVQIEGGIIGDTPAFDWQTTLPRPSYLIPQ